jgi:hypothetical protein
MTHPVGERPAVESSPKSNNILALFLSTILGGFVAFLVTQLQFPAEQANRRSQSQLPPVARPTATLPSTPNATSSKTTVSVAGGLSVSNQTAYPLRLVLLQGGMELGTWNTGQRGQPTHWDFSPNEGSQEGLLLSLPNRQLQLQQGDILMAFALDGSRRYWGPYVVGETVLPRQAKNSKIWQLIVQ